MSDKKQEKPTSTESPKPEATKSEPKWQVVHQIGRTQRALTTPGSPESRRAEYERLCKLGLPGNVILLDEMNRIVTQHANFANDNTRRYRDETGKPYNPTLVELGYKHGVDLSPLRDYIASMPETDPDEDPTPNPPPPALSDERRKAISNAGDRRDWDEVDRLEAEPTVTRPVRRPERQDEAKGSTVQLSDGTTLLVSDVEKLIASLPRRPSPKPTGKAPAPRSKRIESQPCGKGWTGLIGASALLRKYLAELEHMQRRAKARRRRLLLELLIRIASGAPVCRTTVQAAYVDAQDATRL